MKHSVRSTKYDEEYCFQCRISQMKATCNVLRQLSRIDDGFIPMDSNKVTILDTPPSRHHADLEAIAKPHR